MTINIDTEIIATRYDAATKTNHYTIERGGRRWTVEVHDDHFDKLGRGIGSRQRRRTHIANRLEIAMRDKADGEA